MPPLPLIIGDSRQVRWPPKKGMLKGVVKDVAAEAVIKVILKVIDHRGTVVPLISA